jgi:uncharacterized membrane protein
MWWHHGFWFCPIGMLLVALLVWFLIFRFVVFRRYGRCCHEAQNCREADAILKRRLANSEIDESEYQRIMELLKK